MKKPFAIAIALLLTLCLAAACNNTTATNIAKTPANTETKTASTTEAPEYFLLRPEVEKMYGYSHAVRIGDDLKISGAVSMDDKGELAAKGDLEQQMKIAIAI